MQGGTGAPASMLQVAWQSGRLPEGRYLASLATAPVSPGRCTTVFESLVVSLFSLCAQQPRLDMQEAGKLQEQLTQQAGQLQQQQEQQRAMLAAHDHSCEELRDQLAAAEQVQGSVCRVPVCLSPPVLSCAGFHPAGSCLAGAGLE